VVGKAWYQPRGSCLCGLEWLLYLSPSLRWLWNYPEDYKSGTSCEQSISVLVNIRIISHDVPKSTNGE
jgi:hypothetical protein